MNETSSFCEKPKKLLWLFFARLLWVKWLNSRNKPHRSKFVTVFFLSYQSWEVISRPYYVGIVSLGSLKWLMHHLIHRRWDSMIITRILRVVIGNHWVERWALTCWHVMNNATHTQMPARPWAVFVCKKMPSPTWLRGSPMASAAVCESSVVTLPIKFDCVGVTVVVVVADVEFNAFSGNGPDIIYARFKSKITQYSTFWEQFSLSNL